MHIVVMGAGSLGGYFGSFLQRAGNQVTFVARGEHLRAMQTKGLTIRTSEGDTTLEVTATDVAASAVPADLVLLCTKAYSNPEAIEAIRPLVNSRCPVLTVQNGVQAVHDLAAAFGAAQVLPATVAIGCGIVEPGVVYGPPVPAKITLGEMDGTLSERIAGVQQVFQAAGIPVELRPDVPTFLWQKLMYVGPRSVLLALSRSEVRYLPETPGALELFEALMREYVAVGRAEGAQLDDSMVESQVKVARVGAAGPARGAGQMPSLQQDAERRRPLEVDDMIGSVVRLGAACGVPTPVANTLCTLLRLQDVTNRARMAAAM
jgi:2-dehydropantoate 2-reductase